MVLLALNRSIRLCINIFSAEIFAKVSKIGPLQTQPSVIHFDGYSVGNVHQQVLVSNWHSKNSQLCWRSCIHETYVPYTRELFLL